MRSAWLLVAVAACGELSTRTVVTMSRTFVSVVDVDLGCDCDARSIDPGECTHWTDTGPGCGCGAAGVGLMLSVSRDGVVLASGSTQLAGDFSGATLTLTQRRAEQSFVLPSEFPPAPVIVSAGRDGVTWTIDPPTEVLASAGGLFAGTTCRAAAGQTHLDMEVGDSNDLDVTAQHAEDTASGVRIVTQTTVSRAGRP